MVSIPLPATSLTPYIRELHTAFPQDVPTGISMALHIISLPLTGYKLRLLFDLLEATIPCFLLPLNLTPNLQLWQVMLHKHPCALVSFSRFARI